MLLPSWHVLAKHCMIHAKSICTEVLEVCFTLHYWTAELNRGGYESKLLKGAGKEVESGMIADKAGNDPTLTWNNRKIFQETAGVSEVEWAKINAEKVKELTNEIEPYSLKKDLAEHA